MFTYVFDTDQGEVRIRARSHSRAEQALLRRGYVIHGSRTAYESEFLSPLGGGLMAADGFGGLTIDAEGDIGIGIGGGLTLDSSGDIGIGLGGVDVDITNNDPAPEPEPVQSYDSGSSYDSGGGASDFGSGGGDFGGGDF